MQSDGNLVVYQNGNDALATFTSGDNHLVMQTDGNLVVYNTGGLAQWDSGTAGNGFYAVIQADSNFVIYSPSNGAQWDYGSGLLTPVSTSSVGQKIVDHGGLTGRNPVLLCRRQPVRAHQDRMLEWRGYDCTGLDMYAVYQATGIVLPHSGAQGADGGGTRITSEAALEPGDLVFFGGTYDDFVHSGIYAGGGEFWDANDYGIPVQEHSLAWETSGAGALAFVGGGQLLTPRTTPTSERSAVHRWTSPQLHLAFTEQWPAGFGSPRRTRRPKADPRSSKSPPTNASLRIIRTQVTSLVCVASPVTTDETFDLVSGGRYQRRD